MFLIFSLKVQHGLVEFLCFVKQTMATSVIITVSPAVNIRVSMTTKNIAIEMPAFGEGDEGNAYTNITYGLK